MRRSELLSGTRAVRRTTLTFAPLLSLVALWIVHRMDAMPVDRIGFVIGLFLAPLAIGLMLEFPAHLSRIPALASIILNRWYLTPHGVVFQTALTSAGAPWSTTDSLEIEDAGDELTFHLTLSIRGMTKRRSLTCLRRDIGDEAVSTFTRAVRERRFPDSRGPDR